MREFRVGDRARLIINSTGSCNHSGDIGIITKINASYL